MNIVSIINGIGGGFMKNKLLSALAIAIIAFSFISCSSTKQEEKEDNQYKKRATEIVQKSSYEVSGL